MTKWIKSIIIFGFIFLLQNNGYAQPKDSSTAKIIEIRKADRYNYQKLDSGKQFISLAGKVELLQGKTWFFADSAVVNQAENILEAFGNVHINDADSIHTYADYLKYFGKTKIAWLRKNVRLTDGKATLKTDVLDYDSNFKLGTYLKGGKLITKDMTLTSTEGYYYGETKDVYFKNKVVLKEKEFTITTDTLLYNTSSSLLTFLAPTIIKNNNTIIKTTDGFYDRKTKKAELNKYSTIEDSTGRIKAKKIFLNDSIGEAIFVQNVVYKGLDTVKGFDLIANHLVTNKKDKKIVATEKPILILKQGKDTMYVRADTLSTGLISTSIYQKKIPSIAHFLKDSFQKTNAGYIEIAVKDSAVDRYFLAHPNVQMFADSTQAVCDSLFYVAYDSAFRLYKNPLVWYNKTQLKGDSIYFFTNNKKMEKMVVLDKATSVEQLGPNYFNQLAGKYIVGDFLVGKLMKVKTKGSPAESIFYPQDDFGKFIGVNRSSAEKIEASFEDGKIYKVVFINQLEGTSSPMFQVDHSSLRVRNFKWEKKRRPNSKWTILAY